jgi:hypothetical protein
MMQRKTRCVRTCACQRNLDPWGLGPWMAPAGAPPSPSASPAARGARARKACGLSDESEEATHVDEARRRPGLQRRVVGRAIHTEAGVGSEDSRQARGQTALGKGGRRLSATRDGSASCRCSRSGWRWRRAPRRSPAGGMLSAHRRGAVSAQGPRVSGRVGARLLASPARQGCKRREQEFGLLQ